VWVIREEPPLSGDWTTTATRTQQRDDRRKRRREKRREEKARGEGVEQH